MKATFFLALFAAQACEIGDNDRVFLILKKAEESDQSIFSEHSVRAIHRLSPLPPSWDVLPVARVLFLVSFWDAPSYTHAPPRGLPLCSASFIESRRHRPLITP